MQNPLNNGLDKQNPSAFNHMNMLYFQHIFWIMVFFQWVFNSNKVFLLGAPSSLLDSTSRSSRFPEVHQSLQLITLQNRSFSLLKWPTRHLYLQPAPIVLRLICDQIISEIATSIIFGIAKEEGIHDEEYISPVLDKLLREFKFWNKLIPS